MFYLYFFLEIMSKNYENSDSDSEDQKSDDYKWEQENEHLTPVQIAFFRKKMMNKIVK